MGNRLRFPFTVTPEEWRSLANSDGSSVRKVAENKYGFCCPAWTNDGRYLLFETRVEDYAGTLVPAHAAELVAASR